MVMKKQSIALGVFAVVMLYAYISIQGNIFKDAGKAVGDAGKAVGDAGKSLVDSGKKYVGEAGKAGYYVGQVSEDGLKYVNDAGQWVLTEAGKFAEKLAKAVGCLAKEGINVAQKSIKSLAGAAIVFDEIVLEGTLGDATIKVRAKGKVAGKGFSIATSIGKDGFSQNGFKQLFYEPLGEATIDTPKPLTFGW